MKLCGPLIYRKLTNSKRFRPRLARTAQADLSRYFLQMHQALFTQKMANLYVDFHSLHGMQIQILLLLFSKYAFRDFKSLYLLCKRRITTIILGINILRCTSRAFKTRATLASANARLLLLFMLNVWPLVTFILKKMNF